MPPTFLHKHARKLLPACISALLACLVLCCNMSDNGNGEILINVIVDTSFTHFSKTEISMIDTAAGDTTILFDGKLDSVQQLKNIPVPDYRGQQVKILLRGYQNGALVYEEVRIFEGQSDRLTDKVVTKDSTGSVDPKDTTTIPPPPATPNKKPRFPDDSGRKKWDISIKDTVDLTDSALDEDGKIKEYAFDFDGDAVFDSLIQTDAKEVKISAKHAYPDSGIFQAVLRVTDDSGAVAFDTIEVTVEQDAPVVDAGPKVVKPPGNVSLTGSATQKFGAIVMYKWDFDGDGVYDDSSATSAYMTHAYTVDSTYIARFYVRDDDGNVATATREVVISTVQKIVNSPPTISGFTKQFTISIKDTVNLSVTVSDEDGRVREYAWDFNQDGKADSTVNLDGPTAKVTFSKIYPDSGTFALILDVTDDSGATVSDTAVIHVLLDPPKANAGNDTTVTTGSSVLLHADATDQMGQIVKREWKIGNSAFIPVSKTDTTIIVTGVGLLTCTLRVTDDDGNQTADDKVITINPPAANVPPQITTLTVDKNSGLVGDTLSFAAHGRDTDGKVVKYFWDYDGDGIYDDSANANAADVDIAYAHRFVKAGKFSVTLKVQDDQGAILEKASVVDIQPSLPTVNPGKDTTVYAGTTIRLHAAGSDRYGRKVKLEWKGPEGVYHTVSGPDSTVAAPLIATSAVYYLRATDDMGQINESHITVIVILGKTIIHVNLAGRDSVLDTLPMALGNKTGYMLDTLKLRQYSFQKWVAGSSVSVDDSLSRKTNVTLNAPTASLQANLVLKKILVISAVGGFNHVLAIAAAKTAITQMGVDHDFQVVLSDSTKNLTPAYFAPYQAVVFNNVSAAGQIFDTVSRLAFENYFQSGGGLVAFHGSVDQDSTWKNYADYIGSTISTQATPGAFGLLKLDPESSNQSYARGVPATYSLNDEWWNIYPTPRGLTGTKILLTLDESSFPDSIKSNFTMGGDHPVAWVRNYKGGRIFYSSFGHYNTTYTTAYWINHVYQGIVWCANWK